MRVRAREPRASSPTCRAASPESRRPPRSHARPALLFLGVTFERQTDQAVEKRWKRQTAGGPHLGIHPDGRETGNGVDLVEIDGAGLAGHQKVDASHTRAVDRPEGGDRELSDLLALSFA